jgi:hypothetical protein
VEGMFRGHKQGGVAVPWDHMEIISEGVAAVPERCDKNHQGYLVCWVAREQARAGGAKLVDAVQEEREDGQFGYFFIIVNRYQRSC